MYRTIQWPILFLTFFAAAFLRFHALDRQSLWDDELSTVHTITIPRSELIHRYKVYEVHPPLYFEQLRLWMKLGGKSLVSIRADSAFWGSLGLLLMYFLAAHYSGAPGGLLAMVLMGVSPLYLSYSQEARPYALGMALGIAAMLTLEKTVLSARLEPDRWMKIRWVPLGLLWACLLFTHYWGLFVVAAQVLYGYWKATSRDDRRTVLLAFLSACSAFSLWLPILYAQMHAVGNLVFWMPHFSIGQLFKPLVAFSGLFFKVASFVFYLPTRLWILVTFGVVFALALITGLRRGPRGAAIWLVVGLTVPWIISYWDWGMYLWYRYPTLIFPSFILLVTAGLLSWKSVLVRTALITICLGSQVWGCVFYFGGWQKANPKSVVAYIHSLHEPDAIVIRPAYFAELFNFYDHGTMQTLDQHVLDSPEKRAALRGKRIILIAFDVQSDPVTLALMNDYPVVSRRDFPAYAHLGIRVYQLE